MSKITLKQKTFVDIYLETGNASEAYKKVYTSCKKDATARANASRLLSKDNICQYRDERIKQMDEKSIAKPEEVLKYLTGVMRGDIKDQFDLDASLQDRTRAAELLGKRYGVFKEKVDMNVDTTKEDALKNLANIAEQMVGGDHGVSS